MAFWNKQQRPSAVPQDRMTPEWLAQYGRYKFLCCDTAGVFDEMVVVGSFIADLYPQDTPGYAAVLAEVARHAERGEWERVGGWKFARDYLTGESALVDGGLNAIRRMRCTNLGIHLAPIDQRRWSEVIGEPVPNDGFVGPPVFDSEFGPTRQYYFDAAMTAAASRSVTRLSSATGAEPGPFGPDHQVEGGLGNLAMLVYRGPLLVNPANSFEPGLVRPAVACAQGADHTIFTDRLADVVLSDSLSRHSPWGALGAALFIEDYLDPSAVEAAGYDRLLVHALSFLLENGWLGVNFSAEQLTLRQRARLSRMDIPRA